MYHFCEKSLKDCWIFRYLFWYVQVKQSSLVIQRFYLGSMVINYCDISTELFLECI